MRRGSQLRKLAEKFDDELKFFKGWIDRPKSVGSIVPTSSITARRMASVVNPKSGLPVLEVGPGTGVITRAILAMGLPPSKLHLVEYSPDFVRHLRRSFPGVNVIEGDAFDITPSLGAGCPAPLRQCRLRRAAAQLPGAAACRLCREPARPDPGRPTDHATHLRSEVACAAGARQLYGRAISTSSSAISRPPCCGSTAAAGRIERMGRGAARRKSWSSPVRTATAPIAARMPTRR